MFGGLLPEGWLLMNPLAPGCAATVNGLAMGIITLDITDDVWNYLMSKCMAFLSLCVKLASKMDYHNLLFLEVNSEF